MKNVLRICLIFIALMIYSSCDRPVIAYKDIPDVDSTYYPGLWADYLLNEIPEFEQNTNTQRNVLIEKFTGHKCGPCANAAVDIKNMHDTLVGRMFYVNIHAGAGGMTSFQEYNPQASSFYTNHTNSIGLAYGVFFGNGYNLSSLPGFLVNKLLLGGQQSSMILPNNMNQVRERVNTVLADNNLKYNIQAVFNYFNETQGGYLHVEVEKIHAENPDIEIIVYVVQDSLRDWQQLSIGTDPDYLHLKKHLGNIDNQLWGQRLNFTGGNKVRKDYSFGKPLGIEPENIHFLIFISDAETKEVYQVIKKKMVP